MKELLEKLKETTKKLGEWLSEPPAPGASEAVLAEEEKETQEEVSYKEYRAKKEQEAAEERAKVIGRAPRREKKENEFEIIIASDNHGDERSIEDLLVYHDEADFYLHCGDSNLIPTFHPMNKFTTVKGNTDYGLNYKNEERIYLPTGEKIWMGHGHLFRVGSSPDVIISNGVVIGIMDDDRKNPDILLYGHLHKVDVRMEEGFLVISPGSITQPRDGSIKTYAQLFVTPTEYRVNIFNEQTREIIKEFQFPRSHSQAHQSQE